MSNTPLIEYSDRLKDIAFKQRMTRDSDHGQSLMSKVMPELVVYIDGLRDRYDSAKRKPLYISLVSELETPTIAGIVLVTCLDNLLKPISQISLASRVGEFLNQELNYRNYSESKEGADLIARAQKKYQNHRSKRTINEAAKAGDIGKVNVIEWTSQARRSVGLVYLKCLEEMGLLEIVTPKRSANYQWAEHVQQWASDSFEMFTFYTPNHTPLLTPPDRWVEGNKNHSYGEHYPPIDFRLKSRSFGTGSSNGVNMAAADELGSVPYVINKGVFDTALQLWDQGYEIGQLVSSKPKDFLEYPVTGTPEQILEWNRHATKVYTYNQQTHGRRLYYMRTMAILKAYREVPELYFLWVSDSRGRLYPVTSTMLSPQGHDLGKSLLMFKEKKALGERGLYHLHCLVAEYYGVNKVSIADRYQWCLDNMSRVLEVGTSHVVGLWENAEEPWQFLAACIELTNALSLDDPAAYECGLARFLDGKCSGAQHWAALLNDSDVGTSVGLAPSTESNTPPDLYTEVLNTWVEGLLEGRWSDKVEGEYVQWAKELVLTGVMDRKWAKTPVMTYIYGSKLITWSRHITACLRPYYKGDDVYRRGYWLAWCLDKVLTERLSSVVLGMRWLSQAVRDLNKVTDTIEFTSSSGFDVILKYRKEESTRQTVRCLVFRTPIRYSLSVQTEELDKSKQSGASSPNFIHAQDAAHLSLSVVAAAKEGLSLQVIHDSFGTHLCDVDDMLVLIKQEFIGMYSTRDVLSDLKDRWEASYAIELEPLPIGGDLCLSGMIDSAYAFSG